MLFSIIVPVYGVEKFLPQCIKSILAQTFSDFELILVDDGSKDGSGKICEDFAALDQRIKVIHKQNGGLVSARKVGATLANGEYIVCIDGDDWISTHLLERLSSIISTHPLLKVICFGLLRGYGDTSEHYNEDPIEFPSGIYKESDIHAKIYPILIKARNGKRFPPNICGKAIARDLYRKYQNTIPTHLSLGEDAAVIYPLISITDSLFIMKECFYYYRMNPDSITHTRKQGLDWNNLRLLADVWKRYLNPSYDFSAQIDRYMCHDIFNVAKSHLQTKQPYSEMKKMIKKELNAPDFRNYVINAKFDTLSPEQLPRILLKYQLIGCIKLLSHFI